MITAVSKVVLPVDDHIEQTYRGVEFTAAPAQMHFGWWFLFTDQDGTRYALGQW